MRPRRTNPLLSILLTGVTILAGGACLVAGNWVGDPRAARDSAKNPPAATAVRQAGGLELYGAYCAVCHGKDAKGNGPMAKQLKPKVPDLTGIAKQNGGKFPLESVQAIIDGTSLAQTAHGTRDMPIWGPVFSQIEWEQDLSKVRINNLARYLETLQVK